MGKFWLLSIILTQAHTWRDGVAEVDVALGREGDQALEVVSLFHGVGLSPISSVLAVVFWGIQVAVHTPYLKKQLYLVHYLVIKCFFGK